MPLLAPAVIARLSCVFRFQRLIVVCVLILATAGIAAAQTITANGTSGAIAIFRGDSIAINATGLPHVRDWVGLYEIGAPSGYPFYRDWYYLNGMKSFPSSPIGAAAFQFPVLEDPGSYEFRLHRGDTHAVIATSGVVTVQPHTMNVNGIVAPQTVPAAPGATVQVNVFGGTGQPQDWVGIYRVGAEDNARNDWVFLNGTRNYNGAVIRSANLQLKLPLARGPYEARWFFANTYTRMATSTIINGEVTTLAAGGDGHTLVVRQGAVWSAGLNASGQLGVGSTTDHVLPTQIAGLSDVVSVAAGGSHSLAITASGAIHTWGANDAGQLGDDSTVQRTVPTQFSLTDVVAIAAGKQHSVALTAGGHLYTWGLNASGQLGDGTTTNSDVPVQVATGVMAVGAGDHFTVFVKADGSVWGMGDNEFGALGDATGTTRTTPVQMSGITNAIAVAAGQKHAVILLADGAVRATGRNDLGQRGAASVSQWTSNAVGTLNNIVGIAAGDNFSLALDKDGALWPWGDNGVGQLGVATPAVRSTPAAITGLSGVTFVAAGDAFAIAMNGNGLVTTFGENGSGQLGDGTTTDRSTPATSEGFSERLATPTLTVAAGTYTSNFSVIVNHALAGSTLRYTQNGSDPTESDPAIAAGASVSIEQSQTLKVKAWKNGWLPSAVGAAVYEMKATEPSFSPPAGTFSSPTSVTLTTSTPGAVVRYTVDGTAPTAASPQYSGPIAVNTTTTLRAAAFKANWSGSTMSEGTFAMNFGTLGSPTVEPATGTYVGGTTVTMSTAHSGAVVRFTTNGETPTATSAVYAAPISVDGTMTVKARAFHSDYTASAETTRTYTIAAAPPTISPSTGTYASEQTITITPSGSAMTVRYTLDGSEPTEGSTAYAAPFTIDTGTTIKARAFPSGGSVASTVAVSTLSFNFGALPAPTASPAAGVYADAQQIALSAAAGGAIRFTTDGTEPTAESNLYVAPFPVTTGSVAVKARAFHPDWTQSAVAVADYTIDDVPPTISEAQFPASLDGWHNTATTISFVCEDNVGIESCSSSSAASMEGAGQQVVGTAIDLAGRQTTETVTVNLDFTPPIVAISSPTATLTTTDAAITLNGNVSDALSGIAGATCNGETATVTSGAVSCTIALGPGRNDVTLAARDAAGNVTSKGIRVTRTGTSTVLGLTPTSKTLLAEEATTLTLTDEFGAVVTGATWSSTDPLIVSVSSDEPPVLTALQAGTVTITAAKGALSAQASLTVAAGASLPYGTTRWSTSGAPGATVSYTIAANRVDLSVPDLFSVENSGTATIVRGITAAGDVLWSQQSPGTPLMGDSFGGLVAGAYGPNNIPGLDHAEYGAQVSFYARFAGPEGVSPWRYDSRGWLSAPAQAPDGTIYAIERYSTGMNNPNGIPIYDTQVIVLDGGTGAVRARQPLARELRRNPYCANGMWQAAPHTFGPVVGIDGHAYIAVRTWKDSCSSHVSQQLAVDLLRVSPSGTVTSTSIYSQQCTLGVGADLCDRAPRLKGVVPDGVGGTLVQALYSLGSNFAMEMRVTRVLDGAVQFSNVVDANDHIQMIGGGGTAVVKSPMVWRAMDVSTWTQMWSNSNLDLEPVVGSGERGVVMHDLNSGFLHEFNATGAIVRSAASGGRWGYQSAFGHWTEVQNGAIRTSVSMPLNETRGSFTFVGTQQQAPRYKQFKTMELAALSGLDYIYDLTRIARWEFGGVICGSPGAFWWSSIVTNEKSNSVITIDSPGLTPEQRAHLPTCPQAGVPQPVATFHTHLFNGGEPYPSGWIPGTATPNDLTNAIARPDLTFFIRTPNRAVNPTGVFSLRYQAIQEEGGWSARNNLFKLDGATWIRYSPQ